MRISTNAYLDQTLRQINTLNRQMQVQQEQITTGQRVNKAEEDPRTASKVLGARQEQQELVQFRQNASEAKVISDLTEDSLTYLKDLSQQAQSIAQNTALWESPNSFRKQVDSLLNDALNVANQQHDGEYLP